MKLQTSIDEFVAQCSPTKVETTRAGYRDALARFFAAAEVTELKDLDGLDFPATVKALEKKYKPATVAQTVIALRQFLKFIGAADLTVGFKSKPYDNVPDQNVLHEGDPALLLATVTDPRDRAVLTALMLQGWRVSDLCNLKWGNVRPGKISGSWIVEFKTKRGKLRTQGLQAVVYELAVSLVDKTTPSTPFIASASGAAFTRHEVYGLVTRYSTLFGRRVTPHGLRATYISSVISRKGIEAARQLAGHKSLTTTQRYSRWQIDSDDPLTVEDL